MNERRTLPRWQLGKEAKVWMPETQIFSHCIIEDIHLKGLCVSCSKKLFHQQVVSMSFAIGDNFDLIKIEGHIPWVKEDQGRYFYGVSISQIADDDRDRIYQYINFNCFDQFKERWWISLRATKQMFA